MFVEEQYMAKSFTNSESFTGSHTTDAMPSIAMANREKLKIEPCGTSFFNGSLRDNEVPMCTRNDLLNNKFLIKMERSPLKPH